MVSACWRAFVVSLLIIKKVKSKTEKMDFPKLVKENEDLKSQVKSISEKFNAYIMRDKGREQIGTIQVFSYSSHQVTVTRYSSCPKKGIPGFATGNGVLSARTGKV